MTEIAREAMPFIGQQDTLAAIAESINRKTPHVHFVHSLPGGGKTAFLQHLDKQLASDVWQTLYIQPEAERSILDALDTANIPVDKILQQPLTGQFEQPLLLLIDTLSDADSAAFYSQIQSWIAQSPVKLQAVCASHALTHSSKTGTPYVLTLLNEDESEQLAQTLMKRHVLTKDALSLITDFTGGHPGLIQALCQQLTQTNSSVVLRQGIEDAAQRTLLDNEAVFSGVWQQLTPLARIVTSTLTQTLNEFTESSLPAYLMENGIRVDNTSLFEAIDFLIAANLVTLQNDSYALSIEILRLWLADKHPPERLQHELERLDPKTPELFSQARALHRQKQTGAAIEALREAIERNPNHIGSHQLLADILLGEGETQAALNLLESLFRYQPAAARGRLIDTLLKLAEVDEAEGAEAAAMNRYQRILRLSSGQPEALEGQRRIWKRRGDEALKNSALSVALVSYRRADAVDAIMYVEELIRQRETSAKRQQKLSEYLAENT
ncbi:MAG: tetratricopeptide repeat protein, partial [Pseudomonadota bacterium]